MAQFLSPVIEGPYSWIHICIHIQILHVCREKRKNTLNMQMSTRVHIYSRTNENFALPLGYDKVYIL